MQLTFLLFLLALSTASLSLLFGGPCPVSAFEVVRQTSAARRRAKNLPALGVAARARMAVRAFIGKPACNFDALAVNLAGCTVEVDRRLAELVARLNKAGVPTVACCQGWHTEAEAVASMRTGLHATQGAFLKVAPHYTFPDELMEAVVRSRSRLQIGSQTIRVAPAYAYSSELFAANETFMQLLDDWARGEVDRSGVSYYGASLGFA